MPSLRFWDFCLLCGLLLEGRKRGCNRRKHVIVKDHVAACGVALQAYGKADSVYITAALETIRRLRMARPPSAWCKADVTLVDIPITLFTDLSYATISDLVHAPIENFRVDNGNAFDAVPAIPKHHGMERLGPVQYRWFHCQALAQAPYNLTLYLDADATICGVDSLTQLFNFVEKNELDLVFEESIYGHQMTNDNAKFPHPPSVRTQADLLEWSHLKEANAGVVFIASGRQAARQFSADFCNFLRVSFTMEHIQGDQFAFREALWENRNRLKTWVFNERQENPHSRICRYCKRMCTGGCVVVHGWVGKDKTQVAALPGEKPRSWRMRPMHKEIGRAHV